MKQSKLFFLLFLISFSALGVDPRLPERSEFEKFSAKKIYQTIGQGRKEFGLGNWGAKGISMYPPDSASFESEEIDYSNMYKGLDCEHKVGYEMIIGDYDAGPLAVALCEDDNALLQKRFLKIPKAYKSPRIAQYYNNYEVRDKPDGVYIFPVIMIGHGVFVATTIVTFSKDTNRVSVVQLMLDDWVCKKNASENTGLCKGLNEVIIELGSSLLEFEG